MESIPSALRGIQQLSTVNTQELTKQEGVLGRLFKSKVLGSADEKIGQLIASTVKDLENEISILQDRLTIHGTDNPQETSQGFEELLFIIDSIDKASAHLQGTAIGQNSASSFSNIETRAKGVLAAALSTISDRVEQLRESSTLQDIEESLSSDRDNQADILDKFNEITKQYENIAQISEKFEGLNFEVSYQQDLEAIKSILTEFKRATSH